MNVVVWFAKNIGLLIAFSILIISSTCAQPGSGTAPGTLTLQQCIDFALKNQPRVKQSMLDEAINRKDIMISLSGWFPQVNVDANLQHYLQLPVVFFPNLNDPSGPKIEATTGLINTSAALFSANQALYSTDLAFAGRTVHNLKLRAGQNTEISEISTVVDVSKSFYDVMFSTEQLDLWNEEIQRLERTREDAFHLYEGGLTDKIDYQQAIISANNARAQKKNTEEAIKSKYAVLKQSMGFRPEDAIVISYDSASLENEILFDTVNPLSYDKRIEVQTMETNLKLQDIQTSYYRWSFLPSISAFYDYNLTFSNNSFPALYNTDYPNSLIGLKLSLPLFQGTKRLQSLRKAHLQFQRLELDKETLKNQINSQYMQALGSYKSNLYTLRLNKTNVTIAQEVFDIVSKQYNQGIKTFLDVIIAETDLRTAKLNYLIALFQVLNSKLELRAAIGDIIIQ